MTYVYSIVLMDELINVYRMETSFFNDVLNYFYGKIIELFVGDEPEKRENPSLPRPSHIEGADTRWQFYSSVHNEGIPRRMSSISIW